MADVRKVFAWVIAVGVFSSLDLGAESALTQAQADDALYSHNLMRRNVYPPAANMRMLSYDSALATLAQAASAKCLFEHNYGGDYAGLGENIYRGGSTNLTDITVFWFHERLNYVYDTNQCNGGSVYPGLNSCGHYYQVAKGTLTTLGCGLEDCAGKKLTFCEYTAASGGPPYVKGKSCSACPTAAPWCHQRLCVTDAQRNTVGTTNTQCSLVCKNCGTLVSTASRCVCSCATGYTGADCSEKIGSPSLTCSACVAAGTPCQNSGTEASGATACKCNCATGFFGTYCQYSANQVNNGVKMILKGPTNRRARYPVDFAAWTSQMWPALKAALKTAVNTYCSKVEKFVFCCPGAGVYSGSVKEYVVDAGVKAADGYPQQDEYGDLTAVVYVEVSSTNALCAAGSGARRRRRRKRATTSIMSAALITTISKDQQAALAAATVGCCGTALDDVEVAITPSDDPSDDSRHTAADAGGSVFIAAALATLFTLTNRNC